MVKHYARRFHNLSSFRRICFTMPEIVFKHMGRNSVSYNSVLCCAATGDENIESGGFDTIHGDHAVRFYGCTCHFLIKSTGNAGFNFFTFDNLADCSNYATSTLNNAEKSYQRIIPTFLSNILEKLKLYNRSFH